MAQKVVVEMLDDLDGAPGSDVATVGFALDGVAYEIDLRGSNATRLREIFAEFIAAARRSRGERGAGRARAKAAPDTADRERAQAIREWARGAGHEVSERGRIPASVLEAHEAAHRPRKTEVTPATSKNGSTPTSDDGQVASARSDSKVNLPSFSG
jgi:hypothetical protein